MSISQQVVQDFMIAIKQILKESGPIPPSFDRLFERTEELVNLGAAAEVNLQGTQYLVRLVGGPLDGTLINFKGQKVAPPLCIHFDGEQYVPGPTHDDAFSYVRIDFTHPEACLHATVRMD